MHIFKRKDLKTAYKVNNNGSVQLETLETLTKDENKGEGVDIPCDPDNGAVCSVPVSLASGVTTTMNVLNCRNV